MKVASFICRNIDENEIPRKIIKSKRFIFPQAHSSSEDIANLSKQIKEYNKDSICTVPFCSTVEVEAFGGSIDLGDEKIGPRVSSFVYENIEDFKSVKYINLNHKRIKAVLDAIEILNKQGEVVSLNIAGSFMIATSLIDPMVFYKSLIKDRQVVKEILMIIEDNLIEYIREALKRGLNIISFSDSMGTVELVGPRIYKDVAGEITLSVLKKIEALKEFENSIVHICGKTSVSLEKYGFITSKPLKVEDIKYGQSVINLINNKKDINFIGHSCMKETPIVLEHSRIWSISLNKKN